MFLKNKKGVSPLIAAILLIVVTITVGAGAMAFIRNIAQSNLDTASLTMGKVSCASEVGFVVRNNFCKDSNDFFRAFVTNNGVRDIKEFRIIYYGDDAVDTFTIATSELVIGNSSILTHKTTNSTATTLESIVLQPVIVKPGTLDTKVYCDDVVWEEDLTNIGTC